MCSKQNSEISSCVSTLETAPELSKRYDRNVRNVISVTQRVRIQKTRPTHFGSKHLPDEYFIMSYFQFLILFKSRQHFTFVPKCYNTRPEIHQCHSTCTYLAWLTSVCEHTHKLTQWTVHIKRKKNGTNWSEYKFVPVQIIHFYGISILYHLWNHASVGESWQVFQHNRSLLDVL